MNPFLIKMAISVGVAVVSSIAAIVFHNRQNQAEKPYYTDCAGGPQTCTLCTLPLAEQVVRQLNCGHMYHKRCINDKWRHKSTCPLCGHPF